MPLAEHRQCPTAADITHRAWQVAGSWVLTGESATDAGVGLRPRANFDFENGNWGAFQIAARYHALEVDEEAITLGLAAVGASREAEGGHSGSAGTLPGTSGTR